MKINGTPFRTIWLAADGRGVEIIDQTRLPHDFVTVTLRTLAMPRPPSATCGCAARR